MAPSEVPVERLNLSDCALHNWVEKQQRAAVQTLLAPLAEAGVRFAWPGGTDDLPGKYFGALVDEGHLLCWSESWLKREQQIVDLLQSAYAHQFMLLDMDGSMPARVRAMGLCVGVSAGSAARVQLQVLRFALNRIEWSWGRRDSADTVLLPATLKLHFNGQTMQIPADFDGLIAVGRGSNCQVQLPSTYVSRLHGCFQVTGQGFSYRDMSQNGTVLVQGHEEIVLHESETLLAGSGHLQVGDQAVSFEVATS